MEPVIISSDNFEAEVISSDKTVLIDFWASWCGPCRMLSPIVEEVAAERDDIKVCKINVDENEELVAQFGVMSIPLLVVMKNGEIIRTSEGYVPKENILALLD